MTHRTIRSGSPYTLLLEKTDELFSREAAARRRAEEDLAWLSGLGRPRDRRAAQKVGRDAAVATSGPNSCVRPELLRPHPDSRLNIQGVASSRG